MATPSTSAARDWRLRPWAERALVALVVAALAWPGLATAVGLGRPPRRDEPEVAPGGGLAGAAARFDTQFAYRPSPVRLQAWLRLRLPGVSPLATVWRGRDGWWYYADDGAVDDATNASAFTTAELEQWRDVLQRTRDWLAARGIAYVFAIAPDKHVVYPEYLPPGLHRRPGPSRIDQLVAYLRRHSTVPVVDLQAPLAAARASGRLFHRTDSHWNDLGAAAAYRAILEALAVHTPALGTPWPPEAFRLETRDEPGWDLAEMLGLSSSLREETLALVPVRPRLARVTEPVPPPSRYIDGRLVTETANSSRPRVVFYRDSFGSALVPFLAEHASRMVVLWEYDVTPATIRTERPAVVIQEWVGRRLYTRQPYDAFAGGTAEGLSSSGRARR